MGHLEVKHLRMLRTIAETGNMTKAAQRLFISQSALSQQLKDIEGKLVADLFFRTPKKMIPTPMGQQLLQTARTVLQTIDAAELEIASAVSGEKGELKVGTQCVFCYKWLPHVMKRYQAKFPGIDVEIGNATDLRRELVSKKFDIIVTVAPLDDDNFTCSPLFEDQLVCVMASDHPLRSRPYLNLADFGRDNLISHAEKDKNRFYQGVLKPRGVEPKRLMTVGSPQAIMAMVAAGFGMSVFPAWAIRSTRETGGICTRPITKRGLPLTWSAVSLKNNHRPLFQREFVELIGGLNASDIKELPDYPTVAA